MFARAKTGDSTGVVSSAGFVQIYFHFFGFGFPGGAFCFSKISTNGYYISSFAFCFNLFMKDLLVIIICLVYNLYTQKYLLLSGL